MIRRLRKRLWWWLIAWVVVCLADRRALRHRNRYEQDSSSVRRPTTDDSDLELTNKFEL